METFILRWNTLEAWLLMAAGALFVIQLLYYLLLYARIIFRNRAVKNERVNFNKEYPPLSVVICARDEAEHLRRNLTAVLEQDYPNFEVIVINDGNTDESEACLTLLADRYPHLYHSFVPDSSRYVSRKKLAVTLAVKASKYDWLVFTEANCRPASDQWLRLMARNFTSRTDIVLGYSGYEPHKGWLHRKIAFDNLFFSLRYLGCALVGAPYMGIGRNMAYRKELFFKQKGFSSHLHLKRGDDDLFVNETARAGNTRVETDARSATRMMPVEREKDWREERIGYISTARLYKGWQRSFLGLETITRLLFYVAWIAVVVLAVLSRQWIVAGLAVSLFVVRYAVQLAVINLTAKTLGDERRYYFTLPLFDIVQPILALKWKLSCLLRKKQEFMR
ncbi:MAG: glycosyltransferase [Mediterranea sp.]|jgi:glycosyltransferase involved in cell wall biosynthesis|nr:glycosyltransferase [Mediterranea sp.]